MGRRGPLPKRTDEPQHRSNEAKKSDVKKALIAGDVMRPEPDPDWHPIARMLWDAACDSPQNRWYEATDWAVLFSLCDDVSYFKRGAKRSGQMLATINSMMLSLMLTEGDRRRIGVEIQRASEEQLKSPGVEALEDWAKRRAAQ